MTDFFDGLRAWKLRGEPSADLFGCLRAGYINFVASAP
jgi:hypothetical protein